MCLVVKCFEKVGFVRRGKNNHSELESPADDVKNNSDLSESANILSALVKCFDILSVVFERKSVLHLMITRKVKMILVTLNCQASSVLHWSRWSHSALHLPHYKVPSLFPTFLLLLLPSCIYLDAAAISNIENDDCRDQYCYHLYYG